MKLNLKTKQGVWISTEREGVYRFKKNPCINSQIYKYNLNKEKEVQQQTHKFYRKKLSRAFIAELANFSNKGSCGLYEYCALLCWALSYSNSKEEKLCAWISRKINFYIKLFGCKTEKDCLALLDRLYNYGFICYDYNSESKICEVYILAGETDKSSYAHKKTEYTVINNKAGYVMVHNYNIELLKGQAQSFSERDILVDMWFNILFKDDLLPLSKYPVVVFDQQTFSPCITYNQLAKRYKCSVGKIHNIITKLKESGVIDVYSAHKHGAYIFMPKFTYYLWNVESKSPTQYQILSFVFGAKKAAEICWQTLIKKICQLTANMSRLCRFIQTFKLSRNQIWIQFLSQLKEFKNALNPLIHNGFCDIGKYSEDYFSFFNQDIITYIDSC